MRDYIKLLLVGLLIALLIVGGILVKYYIYSTEHPTAPLWMFFLNGR